MFCFQCQETIKNQGCTSQGACGKSADTADLQDLLIYLVKGVAFFADKLSNNDIDTKKIGHFSVKALFATITNVNFDNQSLQVFINQALKVRNDLKDKFLKKYKQDTGHKLNAEMPECARWQPENEQEINQKASEVGVLETKDENLRSLHELITIGVKGLSAYTDHAAILGVQDIELYNFIFKALAATTQDLSQKDLLDLVIKTGEHAVKAMQLLDTANTQAYGHPQITKVNLGVGRKPGILVSGHDLKDFKELLEQTKDSGVDIYTHSEMLPAHYYPEFQKYDHFIGNYGGSWWQQNKDFESFNGPILMTTNCIIPPRDSYKDRLFTTGVAGYPGIKHIGDQQDSGAKDFSPIIELAKQCQPPTEIETGEIVGGFAHNQVLKLADKIVEAVKSGAIKKFIVMAGCDGRYKGREYFTKIAQALPENTVILTAGCAKYRYNKLDLGDINGIPRVLDAGQCNDSYSLAVIALKLKEVFGLQDINQLPIAFDIAWYEQKAVAVLLALLSLGFKNIKLGPSLPAFLSKDVAEILVDKFNIQPVGEVKEDLAQLVGEI